MIVEVVLLAGLTFLRLCLGFLLGERNAGKDKSDDQ